MPPSPRMPSVRVLRSCVSRGNMGIFHVPACRERSAFEKWRRVERMRYSAVVAVASSTAPGVLETAMPAIGQARVCVMEGGPTVLGTL